MTGGLGDCHVPTHPICRSRLIPSAVQPGDAASHADPTSLPASSSGLGSAVLPTPTPTPTHPPTAEAEPLPSAREQLFLELQGMGAGRRECFFESVKEIKHPSSQALMSGRTDSVAIPSLYISPVAACSHCLQARKTKGI